MQESFDLRALRDIGLTQATVMAALAQPRPGGARLARVVEIQRDRLLVHDGAGTHSAVAWPTLRVALELARDALVVGDWVWWRATAPGEAGWVEARLARANRITRRDPAGGRQGLVANVDIVLLVMGLDGDFNLRRLDRFRVLAQGASAHWAVVLTKADRCVDPVGAAARVREHLGVGVSEGVVVAVDGRSPGAAEVLAPWLARGRTLVMLGSSGAGKTTLANTLAGGEGAARPVREGDERGRHTTTVRTLHRLPGGACLIDTPGLRQLWLDAGADVLREAFAEIGERAAQCRFRDCRHASEPGCAVRGQVPAARLDSFLKLVRESERGSEDPFQRRRQHAAWKQRARDNRQRLLANSGSARARGLRGME